MDTSTVFQILLAEGQGHSKIEDAVDRAMQDGSADLANFRIVNTNAGMPAEFRIERI
jgi:hypothetical protein